MRNAGVIIQIAVGRFPSLPVVEPELLRLRLLGWRYRILEWYLSDRHELSLSVRHTFTTLRCILPCFLQLVPGVVPDVPNEHSRKLPSFSHLSRDSAQCQIV